MAEPPRDPAGSRDGLKLINASLFRMGTKSMAQAFIILGCKTHHALLENVMDTPWDLIEKAAEATWPGSPGALDPTRPPFSRKDWDALWGNDYDAVTDLASTFAPQLIQAYPNAKLVIVQRDFGSWWPSFRSQIRDTVMGEPLSSIQAFITSRLLGIRPVHASIKILLGFTEAKTRLGIDEARTRAAYDKYFHDVRAMVPPEQRLEYEIGSGWGPLCEFLGVEEPDVAFPRENDRVANTRESNSRHIQFFTGALRVVGPVVVGVAGVVWAWYYVSKTRG